MNISVHEASGGYELRAVWLESAPRPTWRAPRYKPIHRRQKSSDKIRPCVFVCVNVSFVMRLCIIFPLKPTWMCIWMCLLLFQYRFLHVIFLVYWMWICVCCALVYRSLCTNSPPTLPRWGFRISPRLRRGRSWRDWWRGRLAGLRPAWSSRSGCCPGRSGRRRRRSPMSSRWGWTHPAGRKWCPPSQCRGRSQRTWGRAPGETRWETRP